MTQRFGGDTPGNAAPRPHDSPGLRIRQRAPRLSLRPDEAARALGVSRSFFFAQILPELSVVRRGRLRLVPVSELERWLDRNAARVLEP